MSGRCNQRRDGRSGYSLRHANGWGEKLDLPATSDYGRERVDGGDKSVVGVDLGSGPGDERGRRSVCGELLFFCHANGLKVSLLDDDRLDREGGADRDVQTDGGRGWQG